MSDLLKEAVLDEAAEAAAAEAVAAGAFPEDSAQPVGRIPVPDFSFLLSPTGPGPIEDYTDHPLNYDRSSSTARILRGLTGIAGSLDYAIIDIGLGLIEKIQEKKKVKDDGPQWNYAGQ